MAKLVYLQAFAFKTYIEDKIICGLAKKNVIPTPLFYNIAYYKSISVPLLEVANLANNRALPGPYRSFTNHVDKIR